MDYKKAGVDIEAGYESVKLMKKYVQETMRPEVLGGLGGFSGAFDLSSIKDMEEPVLLSGTDGCGTKVKLAFLMDKHDTIGIDAVAMCVNDVACAGGEPLFFLDYIACGKNYPEKIATIVSGVAEGCKQSGCALVGGETAEHPGLMPEDEYDLAGFAVGVVDKKDIITGENLKDGDVLIGMASTGVHSNGFSLVRKIFDMTKESLDTYYDELGTTLGQALLAPTRIYVKALKAVKDAGVTVKACSHITGGGFYENIPRMLPEGKRAVVEKNSYEVPAIFKLMAEKGNVDEHMMYNTYNMGLGMIVAVDPADVDKTMEAMRSAGDRPYVVGKIIENATMEIPDPMVDTQVRQMVQEFSQRIQSQGLSLQQYMQFTGSTVEQLLEQVKPQAKARIESSLVVLEAVVAAENIETSDEDLEKELEKMADMYQMEADKLKELVGEEEKKQIALDLAVQKAVELVVDAAVEK